MRTKSHIFLHLITTNLFGQKSFNGLNMNFKSLVSLIFLITIVLSCNNDSSKKRSGFESKKENVEKIIQGKYILSGFGKGKGNYNGIHYASNGMIYYFLCTGHLDYGAHMYSFNPETEEVKFIADMAEICDEKDQESILQSKVHTRIFEYKGKIYFGTHTDHLSENYEKVEIIGTPPPGYKPYPGGHLLSYDLETGQFVDLGIVPSKEGVLAMVMDTTKGIIYGTTWPTGYVFAYKVETKEMRDLGPRNGKGESVAGDDREALNRAPVVSYADHKVFFYRNKGFIETYDYERDAFETFEFTGYDITDNFWRQALWSHKDNSIHGNLYGSNILFKIDPITRRIDSLSQLQPDELLKSGEIFNSGLGMIFNEEGNMLFYVAVAPGEKQDIIVMGNQKMTKYEQHLPEDYNMISYNLETKERIDHGKIFLQENIKPISINCLATNSKGQFYAMCFLNLVEGKTDTELIVFSIN